MAPESSSLGSHGGLQRVQLRLLDGFEIAVDGHPFAVPPSAQRLIAFLALHARPVRRAYAAGVLWGDHSDERAGACLRSAVWRSNSAPGARVIDADRSHLQLHSEIQVDVREASGAARAVLSGQTGPEGARLPSLIGELLPGWYDDWVQVERERMRQLCLQAMERVSQALLDAGQIDMAIDAAVTVLAAEPLRESAHRLLVEAHTANGNRAEALRQYDRCCDLLAHELGLGPGDALAAAAARAHGPAAVASAASALLQQQSVLH